MPFAIAFYNTGFCIYFRTLVSSERDNVTYLNSEGETKVSTNSSDTTAYAINPGTYTLKIGDFQQEITIYLGGVYVILVTPDNNNYVSIILSASYTESVKKNFC